MMRKRAVLALAALFAACAPASAQDLIDPERLDEIIRDVSNIDPVQADLSSEVNPMGGVRGQLRPVRHTVLAAGFSGRVDSIEVSVGESVEEGAVLVRMDCGELKADRAAMTARERAAAARYDVNRKLAAVNNVSGLEVDLSRAELAVARAESQRVAARMGYCEIEAPFSGTLTAKHVQAFQHVQAGEPLLDLVDNSELRVEVAVPSAWLARLTPDHSFSLHVEELDRMIDGRILRSAGRVDPVSQTVLLIGRLDTVPPGVMAGMSGSVVLQGSDSATQ
jgi:RND family efflux transporter MFP subunit